MILIRSALRVASFLLLSFLLAPSAGAQASDQDVERIAAVLEALDPAQTESAVAELAGGGGASLPALFTVLEQGGFTVRWGEPTQMTLPLGPVHERVILEAIDRVPVPAVRGFFAGLAAGEPSDEARVLALRVLGRLGSASDLELMARLCAGEGTGRVPRPVRGELEAALVRVFERAPASVRRVGAIYSSADGALVMPVINALEQRHDGERLVTLAGLLGRMPEADVLVLIAIGRVGVDVADADLRVTEAVRRYLSRGDVQLETEAALAIGALQDRSAVDTLIDKLESGDRGVAAAALRALESMSSKAIGKSAERWRDWHAAELRWWRTEAQAELALVRSGDQAEASHVILELAKHRLFRHELAQPLAASLERPETEIVVMGCAALGHLGSMHAVPYLIRTLERPETDVQQAAWRALRRITGLDLGADPAEWEALALPG